MRETFSFLARQESANRKTQPPRAVRGVVPQIAAQRIQASKRPVRRVLAELEAKIVRYARSMTTAARQAAPVPGTAPSHLAGAWSEARNTARVQTVSRPIVPSCASAVSDRHANTLGRTRAGKFPRSVC